MLLKKKVISGTTTTFSSTLKATSVTLSNGNLRANCGNTGGSVFATVPTSSGKWYYEVIATQFEGSVSYSPAIGLATTSTLFNSPWVNNSNELFWYTNGSISQVIYGADQRFNYGVSGFTQGDYIGVAVDWTAKTVQWYRNGIAEGLLNLTTYSAATSFYPCVSSPNGQTGATIVDWQANPKYCPPGYSLW